MRASIPIDMLYSEGIIDVGHLLSIESDGEFSKSPHARPPDARYSI